MLRLKCGQFKMSPRIKFYIAAIMVVTLQYNTLGIQTNSEVGSNWYFPTTTTRPLAIISPSVSGDPSIRYNTVQNGKESSFVPTSNVNLLSASQVGQQENNNRAFLYPSAQQFQQQQQQQFPTGEQQATGKQYQYLQYHPEGNSFHIYPTSGAGLAEQRQEFLDPNVNGLAPFEGGGEEEGGGSIFDNIPSFGGITSGIGGTASNIAQSIGLGSLGLLGSVLVLVIGAPLIVFAIVFPAAIIVIAVLGFPVLQLTLPPSDPNLGRVLKSGVMNTARKAREVLQSEECVERFSCAIARKSRTLPYESWILEKMDKVGNSWANRISKSVKSGRAGEDCQHFKCAPVAKLKKVYDALVNPQTNSSRT